MSSALHRDRSLTALVVATYARFSTDLQRDASLPDQDRICGAEGERQGWQAGPAFSDRALSSSITLRPGYQSLLDGVRHRAFDIIMAQALERLSRDQEDLAAFPKRCVFAGIRIFTLAEGWISESHVGLKGTMSALFLKDLADKTRRGLRGRAGSPTAIAWSRPRTARTAAAARSTRPRPRWCGASSATMRPACRRRRSREL